MSAVCMAPTGWSPTKTATGDPRVPVMCGWCLGRGAYLERMELGATWEHLPIVCQNCGGAGSVRIERRRGAA